MPGRRYTCIVCGRPFPEGQGIVITKSRHVLHFHSRRCAYRFLRMLLERLEDGCVSGPLGELVREYNKLLAARRERAKKVI